MISFLKSHVSPRFVIAIAAMTLLASVVMGREDRRPDVVALATPTRSSAAATDATDLDIERLLRSKSSEGIANLFAPRVPPPPPTPETGSTAAPPAPDPVAPPLPFTYLGQYIDGEKNEIFVARGDEHYTVEKGKTIEGQYKVEKISDNAVTFIYLPLGTRQKLAIPALK